MKKNYKNYNENCKNHKKLGKLWKNINWMQNDAFFY